jgi:hypothetical protein
LARIHHFNLASPPRVGKLLSLPELHGGQGEPASELACHLQVSAQDGLSIDHSAVSPALFRLKSK